MALITGIFILCFAIVVAEVKLPLPVPLAFRPKKSQDRPVAVCNSTDLPPCADIRFGFCVNDDNYPMDHIQAAIENSELVNQFSYKTVPREEIVRGPVKIYKKERCLSSNILVKPIRMPNIDGNWRVIIQDAKAIIQRERIVLCTRMGDICQTPGKLFGPLQCHTSRCTQKFIVRELLAYDLCDPSRGAFVDSFKIPSACSCLFLRSTLKK